MEAKELRIGNIVMTKKGIARVVEITDKRIERLDTVTIYRQVTTKDNYRFGNNRQWTLKEIKPIPLTQKILLDNGFEVCYDGRAEKRIDHIQRGEIGLIFHIDGFIRFRYYSEREHIKCDYVHQLQNLYYALTGEELSIVIPPTGAIATEVDSSTKGETTKN